jgi:hypothetical protein
LDEIGIDVTVLTGPYVRFDKEYPEQSDYRIDPVQFRDLLGGWLDERPSLAVPRPPASRSLKLFVAIHHNARLLDHFLTHYHAAGVGQFFIAAAVEFESEVQKFSSKYNIVCYTDLDVSDTVIGKVSAVSEMRQRHQDPTEWAIIVDLDEFIEFKTEVRHLIECAESEKANVVRGIMWDRFPSDGRIRGLEIPANLKTAYPIKARFIKDIMGGADYKGVLVKGLLKSESAHHNFQGEFLFSSELEISHYKWTPGSIDRLETAYRMVVDAGEPWAFEYARVLEHYHRHGRFAWEEFGGQFDIGTSYLSGPVDQTDV